MIDFPVPMSTFNLDHDRDGQDGWSGGRPPGITWLQWPRSPDSGLPMKHLFTVRVPESYRVQGPELVALSLFQDGGESDRVPGVAEVLDGGPALADGPFWDAVVAYAGNRHPKEHAIKDEHANGGWALIWLTAAEFAAPLCELPELTELPWFETAGVGSPDSELEPDPLCLQECHVDPNAGQPGTTEYDEDNLADDEWEPELCHFGGTVAYYNGFRLNNDGKLENGPFGISPWYLEFDESLCGANVGGGSGLLDLHSGEIAWSCP